MLEFRHALTAIKIAVGQNLSWNKQIDRIEIRNALSKGKYTLSDHLNGAGEHLGNHVECVVVTILAHNHIVGIIARADGRGR